MMVDSHPFSSSSPPFEQWKNLTSYKIKCVHLYITHIYTGLAALPRSILWFCAERGYGYIVYSTTVPDF